MQFTLASVLLFLSIATAIPLGLPSATRDISDLTVREDTTPVMTDSAGEVVPFDSAAVVTKE